MELSVRVSDNHLQVVDRVVVEDTMGNSRQQVLLAALRQHISHLVTGGRPYDGGPPDVLEVSKPEYGPVRFEHVMEPVTGKAVPVYQGEVLRLIQLEENQCIDFNAYNLHDYKEWLDNGFNRMTSFETGKGTIIWSGCSRARPMYAIMEMSPTCDQFYAGFRCHALLIEKQWGIVDHPNCQDTFAETIRQYGLTPDDVHDSYNFWMAAELDPQGRRYYPMSRAKKGDVVELLALFDTLAAPIICGGDMSPVNSFELHPMQIQVLQSTPATLALVDQVQERYGSYCSQRKREDFLQKDIRAQPELRPDPSYVPQFLPAPQWHNLQVEVTAEESSMLQSLVSNGHYGATPEKALLSAFLRWHAMNRQRKFLPRLGIKG